MRLARFCALCSVSIDQVSPQNRELHAIDVDDRYLHRHETSNMNDLEALNLSSANVAFDKKRACQVGENFQVPPSYELHF